MPETLEFVAPGYVPQPGEIIQVDAATGKLHKVREYTPDELQKVMRDAPIGIGREPMMLGVRTAGLDAEGKRIAKTNVQNAGAAGQQKLIGRL